MGKSREYINRWPRATARLIDLVLGMFIVLSLLKILGYGSPLQNLLNPISWVVLFLAIPAALLIDSLFATLFGNTPAKALVGVRVTTHRGETPGIGARFRRNYGVWTDGLGLGIVPLSLHAMFKQYRRVSGRREAVYDEKLHLRVSSSPHSALRSTILLSVLTAGMLGWLSLG